MSKGVSVVSSLREIVLDSDEWDPMLPVEFDTLCMQRDASSGDAVSTAWFPTIGLQVTALTSSYAEHDRLLGGLARNAHRVSDLATLNVRLTERQEVVELVDCLAQMTSLKTLDLYCSHISASPVIRSLKTNGTLECVSINGNIDPIPRPLMKRLVQASTDRNQFLPGLLEQTGVQSTEEAMAHPSESTVNPLYPTLMQVATQITRTRAASLASCLVKLGDAVGSSSK